MQYKVTITTLTPLHIGTGQELLDLYDLRQDPQRRQTYRLNVDAILEDALTGDDPQLDQRLLSLKPGELVDVATLRQRPDFSQYVLAGTPRSGQVKEQVKDVWGQLYLPGSSLKGALRTVIARSIAGSKTIKPQLRVNYERRRQLEKKAADDLMEQLIFGRNPNYDLLKALQVADSRPVTAAPELINASVIKKGTPQAPVDLEAIPANTTFETTIHLDSYLYQEQAEVVRLKDGQWGRPIDKLGWSAEQTRRLETLPIAARNVARDRFKQEIAYFKAVGLNRLADIYQTWQRSLSSLKGTETFYLQLGWGGGWENKTLGQELIAQDKQGEFNAAKFAELRDDFELGKPPRFRGNWRAKPEDPFPASRRLRLNSNNEPVEPLGWVEIILEAEK